MKEKTTMQTTTTTAMANLVSGLKKSGYSDSTILELITSNSENENLVSTLKDAGYSDSAILALITSDSSEEAEEKSPVPIERNGKIVITEHDMMERVSEILHELGVPAHIKGYPYVRKAIVFAVKDPETMESITKIMYPTLAKYFGTTSSRLERAIRHAIEVAWDRGDVDVFQKYFGYTIQSSRGKPTNSEFIAMLSDKLRMKYIVE